MVHAKTAIFRFLNMETSSPKSSYLRTAAAGTAAGGSVFEDGKYSTAFLHVDPDKVALPPPKPLLIATPSFNGNEGGGVFPVVLFLHGYCLCNSFYTQLLGHIASHGFIVVAPQLYTLAWLDTTAEMKSTAATTDWLPGGLPSLLPSNVDPDLTKVALAGHSRGGKVAFALALKMLDITTTLPYSALIGVDPVDGLSKGAHTNPQVLTYVPNSLDIGMPVLVIGSGLGEVKSNPIFPACTPTGMNHNEFYSECEPPAGHLVVKNYGHMDMLDDETDGIRGRISYCLCKNGESRGPMRRFVGGAVVAFLGAYFQGDDRDLVDIREGRAILPVELQKNEFRD